MVFLEAWSVFGQNYSTGRKMEAKSSGRKYQNTWFCNVHFLWQQNQQRQSFHVQVSTPNQRGLQPDKFHILNFFHILEYLCEYIRYLRREPKSNCYKIQGLSLVVWNFFTFGVGAALKSFRIWSNLDFRLETYTLYKLIHFGAAHSFQRILNEPLDLRIIRTTVSPIFCYRWDHTKKLSVVSSDNGHFSIMIVKRKAQKKKGCKSHFLNIWLSPRPTSLLVSYPGH